MSSTWKSLSPLEPADDPRMHAPDGVSPKWKTVFKLPGFYSSKWRNSISCRKQLECVRKRKPSGLKNEHGVAATSFDKSCLCDDAPRPAGSHQRSRGGSDGTHCLNASCSVQWLCFIWGRVHYSSALGASFFKPRMENSCGFHHCCVNKSAEEMRSYFYIHCVILLLFSSCGLSEGKMGVGANGVCKCSHELQLESTFN